MKDILAHLIQGELATSEQVTRVFDHLLQGDLDPHFGAAFLALQMRNGVDGPQLKAALDVLMRHASVFQLQDPLALDNCGTGGDGGTTFNVSTTAAFVIAGAGHTVAKHGNRAVSSSCGSADLLEALGVRLDLTPDQAKACIETVGIGFMFAPTFHPAIRHALPMRKALGVRTIFNMLGPLANPAQVKCQMIGVFDEALTDVFGEAIAASGKTAFIVYGEDGADEVSLATRTKVTAVRDGSYETWIFDPRRHGFDLIEHPLGGGNLALNKSIFESVLKEREPGPNQDMVVLNAGFAMFTTGKYGDLDQAFEAARESLTSGAAWRKVEALIDWTRSQTAEG